MKTKKDSAIILASQSPRRRELLGKAGIKFEIVAPEIDETFDDYLTPSENAIAIALKKAEEVAHKIPDRLTLAADTIVVHNKEVIGKPVDRNDAIKMLSRLADSVHTVITAVAIVDINSDTRWTHAEESNVTFGPIPKEAIIEYVDGGEPMDKAGAYAIQGGAAKWIKEYSGSLTNIIGLPMEKVKEALSNFGIS